MKPEEGIWIIWTGKRHNPTLPPLLTPQKRIERERETKRDKVMSNSTNPYRNLHVSHITRGPSKKNWPTFFPDSLKKDRPFGAFLLSNLFFRSIFMHPPPATENQRDMPHVTCQLAGHHMKTKLSGLGKIVRVLFRCPIGDQDNGNIQILTLHFWWILLMVHVC